MDKIKTGIPLKEFIFIVIQSNRINQAMLHFRAAIDQIALNNYTTAMLWVICPLVILLCMHALVVWVAVSGINFQ
jgi:hypothetical protein